ncbi:MAG: amidohydrolase family protein [Christensenellales bacterium]
MKFDYMIKNGWVFDGKISEFSKRTVYVRDGIIENCSDESSAESEKVVDAGGKYVLPGLVDAHAHLNYLGSNIGANADLLCIPNGVTAAVDAGTTGCSNFELFYQSNVVRCTPAVMAFINCSSYGIKDDCIHPEDYDPRDFKFHQIRKLIKKYPDVIRGIKIRVFKKTMEPYGLEPLKEAVKMADALNDEGLFCIVNMHYSGLPEGFLLADTLGILRPGDIFSHVFIMEGERIFNSDGSIKDCVLKAREKGILFETANGRPMWSFENLDKAFAQGFYPYIISSDTIHESMYQRPCFSLTHAMSVMSAAGMDIKQIFQAVTYHPAKALGILGKAGTLDAGACADISIFDVRDSDMILKDRHGGQRKANKLFVPLATMRAGKIVYRQVFF